MKPIESDAQKIASLVSDLARLRKKLDGASFSLTALIFGLARLNGQVDCMCIRIPHLRSVLTSIDAINFALASLRPPVTPAQRQAVITALGSLSESLSKLRDSGP